MHMWKAIKFSKNSKAVKYYVYVLSNWRMHRLSQYFDIPTQMNALVFRSLQSFTLICFDRDKNSQVTISSVTDRSDSVNSSYRCFNKRGSKTQRNSPGRHGLGKSSRVDFHLLGGGNNGWTMRGRVCHMTMFIVRKISCFLLVKKA